MASKVRERVLRDRDWYVNQQTKMNARMSKTHEGLQSVVYEFASDFGGFADHCTRLARSMQHSLYLWDQEAQQYETETEIKVLEAEKAKRVQNALENKAARAIQKQYRASSASPYTKLGRHRILRNGGFDPKNHPGVAR